MYYILKDKQVVRATKEEWVEFFPKNETREVAKDNIGDYFISTVFFLFDHGCDPMKPVLFETMVFKDEDWSREEQIRYCTWDEAIAGHNEMVSKYKDKKMTELKPCPFCGDENILIMDITFKQGIFPNFYAICFECSTRGYLYSTKQEAIDAWNKRVECKKCS